MADNSRLDENVVISFDILPDFMQDEDEINIADLTQEQQEALSDFMEKNNLFNPPEENDDATAFEPQSDFVCFVKCSEEDLDNYADAGFKETTKWQTKWALNVFTGNY